MMSLAKITNRTTEVIAKLNALFARLFAQGILKDRFKDFGDYYPISFITVGPSEIRTRRHANRPDTLSSFFRQMPNVTGEYKPQTGESWFFVESTDGFAALHALSDDTLERIALSVIPKRDGKLEQGSREIQLIRQQLEQQLKHSNEQAASMSLEQLDSALQHVNISGLDDVHAKMDIDASLAKVEVRRFLHASSTSELNDAPKISETDRALCDLFHALEPYAKSVEEKSPLSTPAKLFTRLLEAGNALTVFKLYEDLQLKEDPKKTDGTSVCSESIADLKTQSEAMLLRAMKDGLFILNKEREASAPRSLDNIAPDNKTLNRVINLLGKDIKWMQETESVLRRSKEQIAKLMSNSSIFNKFNAQYKNPEWPHHPDAKRQMELAGFKHTPGVTVHDRCTCSTCHVVVSHLRFWHTPAKLHNSKIPHAVVNSQPSQTM